MLNKWKKMAPSDQLRVQILIGAVMLALFAPFYGSAVKTQKKTQNSINRRQNRIETRATVSDVQGGGLSSRTLQNRIKKVNEEIDEITTRMQGSSLVFAKIDSSEDQQKLRLALAQLAAECEVRVTSVATRTNGDGALVLDRELKRPLMDIKCRTSYGRFVQLLDGLKELPYHVSVLHFKMATDEEEQAQNPQLNLELVLLI